MSNNDPNNEPTSSTRRSSSDTSESNVTSTVSSTSLGFSTNSIRLAIPETTSRSATPNPQTPQTTETTVTTADSQVTSTNHETPPTATAFNIQTTIQQPESTTHSGFLVNKIFKIQKWYFSKFERGRGICPGRFF